MRAVVPNDDRRLRVGMFARVRLTLDQPRETLLVPERAVGIDQGQRFVYVVNGDNKVEYRKVSIGQVFDGKLAILEGLQAEDRVITEGLQLLRPGQAVQPGGRARKLRALQPRSEVTRILADKILMGGIPRFFIDRPIFASVIAIVTVFVGVIALFNLPVAQYPNIVPPTVTVTATYAGANAETVASTVAAPIEQQINGVDNMLYIASTSTSDGQMTITVTFEPGTDPDTAQVLVQNRVQAAESKLPEVVRSNGVVVRKRSPDFTMAVSMVSPDGRYDDLYLSNYAFLQVSDYLARIKGVGDIQFFGARDYSMRIWLNPEKIAALGHDRRRRRRGPARAKCADRGGKRRRPAGSLWAWIIR